jgi:amino acid transporter
MPRGILGAIAASLTLYVVVSTAAVIADSTAETPLLDLFEGRNAAVFAAVASIAVANGVLVQIVMLSRLFYGMAAQGQLPALLGQVDPRTRVPTRATLLAGAIVLGAALSLPFEQLLVLTTAVTLAVFGMVDLALWRVQRRYPPAAGFALPGWVPLAAATMIFVL